MAHYSKATISVKKHGGITSCSTPLNAKAQWKESGLSEKEPTNSTKKAQKP
jgi:hypothetical protein